MGDGPPAREAPRPEPFGDEEACVRRRGNFQRKLVLAPGEQGRPYRTRETGQADAAKQGHPPARGELTKLEKQVLAFKKKYPGMLLLFEVGYKVSDLREGAPARAVWTSAAD